MSRGANEQIRKYYAALYRVWGPQHWCPARTRFEVVDAYARRVLERHRISVANTE